MFIYVDLSKHTTYFYKIIYKVILLSRLYVKVPIFTRNPLIYKHRILEMENMCRHDFSTFGTFFHFNVSLNIETKIESIFYIYPCFLCSFPLYNYYVYAVFSMFLSETFQCSFYKSIFYIFPWFLYFFEHLFNVLLQIYIQYLSLISMFLSFTSFYFLSKFSMFYYKSIFYMFLSFSHHPLGG